MRLLELRRHSVRTPGTNHLSPHGIALARRVGAEMGPFAGVITSPSSWTCETAAAMGFAIDEQYAPVAFSDLEWKALDALMPPDASFAARLKAMQHNPLAKRLAAALRAQWSDYAARIPENECLLVVTHGGYIDDSAVACLPSAPHELWGGNFSHCEGIRLAFSDGEFVSGEILRV